MPKGQKKTAEGEANRAAMLESIKASPKTPAQLSIELNSAKSAINLHLRRLHEARKIYVCGHVPNNQGMPARIWAAGDKPDVEYVPLSCPAPKISAARRRQMILDLLQEKPLTAHEIAKRIHVVKETVSTNMRPLRHGEGKKIYIIRYLPAREVYPGTRASSWVPVYAVGNKKDAPAPKKETSAARYARLGKTKEYKVAARLRAQLNHIVKKTRKKPQGIFAALGL